MILQLVKDAHDKIDLLGKTATVGWVIWKARNQFIFSREEVNGFATVIRAQGMWNDLFMSPNEEGVDGSGGNIGV